MNITTIENYKRINKESMTSRSPPYFNFNTKVTQRNN